MHRDIIVTALIVGSLPFCFLKPWVGILVWSWIGYMNPHRLTWGFAYNMPFSQMVAIATLIGLPFAKERSPFPRSREVFLLILLWLTFVLSTVYAIYPKEAWIQFEKVSKILLMTFVPLLLFQNQKRLHALLLLVALSIGFFGFKGGIWSILTGGHYTLQGPPDSFIEGNTNLGLALNMMLPILFFLGREESRKWLRLLFLTMFFLSIVSILVTYSRGSFLGLAVVLALLLLKSRKKILGIFLLTCGIFVGLSMLPGMWFERIETMKTYQEDRSSMGRIRAWQVSYKLALDRPLLGGGFEPFSSEIYRRYLPEELLESADVGTGAHNIFFQVLAEHGFTGLLLYISLIVFTIFSLRKMARGGEEDPELRWLRRCASMLEVSIAGYVVSGFFLSMCYFDLFFLLVAVAIILRCLVSQRLLSLQLAENPVQVPSTIPHSWDAEPVEAVRG
jgi:probable O-glycosylation ligase (exosortase A-associated)